MSFAQSLAHKPGEVLIKVKSGLNQSAIRQYFAEFNGVPTNLSPVRLISPQLNIWKWSFDANAVDELQLLQAMRRSPVIEMVQFNHLLKMRTSSNDSQLNSQWQWINTGADSGSADADVDADEAWDITTGGLTATGDTIVVAVIDDGTDLSHEDLIDNIWTNNDEIPGNNIDDDNNGYIDDFYGWNSFSGDGEVDNGGHGVAVSGMIGAKGNNGKGVTGINWNVKIMMIVGGSGAEDEVIMSYSYALKQRQDYNQSNGTKGAFVVATNSSWGIDGGQPEDAPLWCAFYDTLGINGILSVGATANNSLDIDQEGDLPTACSSEYLIAVTATDNNDKRTFSAWGLNTIDVGAPGGNIFTTEPNSSYGNTSGTSFASPLTAGLIALLYSAPCSNLAVLAKQDPAEAAKQIRDYIFQGVDKTDQLTAEIKYGGRVNAKTSLDLLMAACGPCPAPNSIQLFGITDKSASFIFSTIVPEAIVEVRYRIEGFPDWIVINDANSPLKVQDLVSCSIYEYSMRSVCPEDSSQWLPAKTFKTDGCCENPAGFEISFFDESSVVLTWDKVLIAQGYQVEFKEKLEGDWQIFDTQNTSFEITGLLPCTQYLFSVRTICGDNTLPWSDTLKFKTVGCGACTDLVYCETQGNSDEEWLESLVFGDINSVSGNNGGYASFTDGESTVLTPGLSYPISMTPGYNFTEFNEYFYVYIDWDQNGKFDFPAELAFSGGPDTKEVTGTIDVPLDAFPGYTRMRASLRFSSFPDDPCNSFGFGESEDYCVLIKDPACKLTPEVLVSDITYTTAKLTWSKVEDALVYTFRYRKQNGGDWTEVADTASTFMIGGLELCTNYEFQVQTVCLEDTSGYTSSLIFQTQCVLGTDDEFAGVDKFLAYPNPFSNSLQLEMEIAKVDNYQLDVFDLNGKQLIHQEIGQLLNGKQSVTLRDAAQLESGIYFVRLSSSTGNAFIKVVCSK